MYVGKTLFAQVMEFVPWTSFARIVQRHGGNSGVRALSCAEQFRAMAFAQPPGVRIVVAPIEPGFR
jgi:Na+/citrate or Na+/malate symporter